MKIFDGRAEAKKLDEKILEYVKRSERSEVRAKVLRPARVKVGSGKDK